MLSLTLRILSLGPGRSHFVRNWLVLAPPFTDEESDKGKEVTAKLSLISSFVFTITLSVISLILIIVTSDVYSFTPSFPFNSWMRQPVLHHPHFAETETQRG